MKEMEYLEELTGRCPVLEVVKEDIRAVYELLEDYYEQRGKVLIAGNGGGCADSKHTMGELMKGSVKRRPVSPEFVYALRQADPQRGATLAERLQGAFPAITFIEYIALSTVFLNDVDGEMTYAQQLYGYGKEEDIFIGISILGNAENVMYAVTAAEAMGIKVISLAGKDGGALAKASDVPIAVPEKETLKTQELHLPVYCAFCPMLEEHFYEV